jgi:hypothetical protein
VLQLDPLSLNDEFNFIRFFYGVVINLTKISNISLILLEFDDDTDLDLPTRDSTEFRPFARRLPEFKFWEACTRAVVIAFFMTFLSVFDVPVFWPILLMYFIILFYITMKRQISHMIKHKYVPFSFGKPAYKAGAAKDSK